MDKEQAISLVQQYKKLIAPHFDGRAKVYMFGSYSKGYARLDSDIDVAVIVPSLGGIIGGHGLNNSGMRSARSVHLSNRC